MLKVIDHPLIKHKLTVMRKKETGTKDFRQNLDEIGGLMVYEITRDLPLKPIEIETPICQYTGYELAKKVVIVPILRAGLGMVNGIQDLIPTAKIAHVGMYRDEETLEPHTYFEKYPKNLEETLYIFGQSGTVKIGGTSTNNIDVWDFADETKDDENNKGLKEQTSNVYGNGHTSLFADVIDAIENDRTPYVDAIAGRNALEVVLAIYKSQKTGEPVKFPLTDFASIDMEGEF